MKKRLLFLTGSRGEWGYIRPILRLCQRDIDVDYSLCATNMHLLPVFGHSIKEIEADGFTVHHRLHMALDGYSHVSMVKSLGLLILSLADIIASDPPDWIVLAGDRGEQLAGAIVGAFTNVPVAHIQAGELSGNIDGMTRHAIGKYVHLHLCSNEDAYNRLVSLGEQTTRIHNVGAPQLDELLEGYYSSANELNNFFTFDVNSGFFLVVQHPITEDHQLASVQIRETISALNQFTQPKIVVCPNNDAGSHLIRDGIHRYKKGSYHIVPNLPRRDYLGLLKLATCLIGNSSSGILEAPTFKIPAINIGRRQAGRLQATNVINSEFDATKITAAIRSAQSPSFIEEISRTCFNPYGDGRSSKKIFDLLRTTKINDALLTKRLTY